MAGDPKARSNKGPYPAMPFTLATSFVVILKPVFHGVGEWTNGLLLERGRPPIPKLGRAEGAIDGRRSTSPPFLPMNARGRPAARP